MCSKSMPVILTVVAFIYARIYKICIWISIYGILFNFRNQQRYLCGWNLLRQEIVLLLKLMMFLYCRVYTRNDDCFAYIIKHCIITFLYIKLNY